MRRRKPSGGGGGGRGDLNRPEVDMVMGGLRCIYTLHLLLLLSKVRAERLTSSFLLAFDNCCWTDAHHTSILHDLHTSPRRVTCLASACLCARTPPHLSGGPPVNWRYVHSDDAPTGNRIDLFFMFRSASDQIFIFPPACSTLYSLSHIYLCTTHHLIGATCLLDPYFSRLGLVSLDYLVSR